MDTLNEAYSSVSLKRRYEAWFLRLGLADGCGAWWFRYLLLNPGRSGCSSIPQQGPVQVWATWFPSSGKPRTFIQCFPVSALTISRRGGSPFFLRTGGCEIEENSCRGNLTVEGHNICWDLRYKSTFRVTMSNKGWIGFSRSSHSDANFSGEITFDGRRVAGDPLGFGVQGHNCGYRHRDFWVWAHAYVPVPGGAPSTVEALVYNMPLGMTFRKVVLWYGGLRYVFRRLYDETVSRGPMFWKFRCKADGMHLDVEISGSAQNVHCLPYAKTDCSGTFEVLNNSLASAAIQVRRPGKDAQTFQTSNGAVLEMGGSYSF